MWKEYILIILVFSLIYKYLYFWHSFIISNIININAMVNVFGFFIIFGIVGLLFPHLILIKNEDSKINARRD